MSTLVLTEDQEDIRRTARDFVKERAPVTMLRGLRDSRDATGLSRELWKDLAGLGLVGMALPEAYGGGGLGFAELGLVLEELGRNLVPTPFLSTVVLGAGAVLLAGSEAQKQDVLPAVCRGERLLAFALDEGTRYGGVDSLTMRAERGAGGGFTLRGAKSFVLDGHIADVLVVVARVEADVALFLVPREAAGVTVRRLDAIDSRNVARVSFDGVVVPERARLPGADAATIERLVDRGAIALAAEMFGGVQEAFERTIAYLKVRKQFGVPIGSFQALKHRAAHLFCEVELSRSIVLEALRALDDAARPTAEVSALASVAKARLSDTYVAVAAEAIQMHGGIGVTDELDIGFFYKRANTAAATLGSSSYHRDRFARLRGY